MKTLTRLLAIALVSVTGLTACGGGGGGGGGGGAAAPAPVVGVGDIVIDAFTVVFSPTESVFTGFEFTLTAPFSIGGTPPFTAEFSSGQALTRGNPALYEEGDFAWHILNNSSATVTFGTPPSILDFFVLTENTTGIRTVEIFDEFSDLILTVTPMNIFERVTVTRVAPQTLIGSMLVTNTPP